MSGPPRRVVGKVLVIVLGLALTACSIVHDPWVRARSDDDAYCRNLATQQAAKERFEVGYQRCMEERGWQVSGPTVERGAQNAEARGGVPEVRE